jgi:hypothetical protein
MLIDLLLKLVHWHSATPRFACLNRLELAKVIAAEGGDIIAFLVRYFSNCDALLLVEPIYLVRRDAELF